MAEILVHSLLQKISALVIRCLSTQQYLEHLNNSISELKSFIEEDIEDKCFDGAGKKRTIGPDELENSGFMFLKMKKVIYRDLFKSSQYLIVLDDFLEPTELERLIEYYHHWVVKGFGGAGKKQILCLDDALQNPGIISWKKIKISDMFGFDREGVLKLSCYTKATGYHWKPSSLRDNNESCVVLDIELGEQSDRHGNMASEMQDRFSTHSNLNKNKHNHNHKDMMPREPVFQLNDTLKRKEIAQHASFAVLSSVVFLRLFFDTWIQSPLLVLFTLVLILWAFSIIILVGIPFSRMQSAMLIFLAILMHLKSASTMFVPILFGLFCCIEWFAHGN